MGQMEGKSLSLIGCPCSVRAVHCMCLKKVNVNISIGWKCEVTVPLHFVAVSCLIKSLLHTQHD